VIRPVVQPVTGPIRDVLEQLAVGAGGGTCRIWTAWMTPDGISLANDLLVRNAVVLTEILVGINRSGTSARAMRTALDVLAQSGGVLRYYLDGKLAGPIYHPKVWFFESPTFRGALVGSPNLTREGLLNNVEAAVAFSDGGGYVRNEASDALDELKEQIEALTHGRYAVTIDDEVLARLVEIGAVPESTARQQRDDADDEGAPSTNADERLGVEEPRERSWFRAPTPLPGNPGARIRQPREARPARVAEADVGARLRYVRYFRRSEANRVRKYFREGGNAGTFESNFSMQTRAEEGFWGHPDRFTPTGKAVEWVPPPRVRLITIRNGSPTVTLVANTRLWVRIRDGRQTERRFEFANTSAVRDAFPTDIAEDTVIVVDRAEDLEADFEVRLVRRGDPGYSDVRPAGGENAEYKIV
jgi:HKD family nuclease